MAQGRKVLRRCYNCSKFKYKVLTRRNIFLDENFRFKLHAKLMEKIALHEIPVWYCRAGCTKREYYITQIKAETLRNMRCKYADYFKEGE